MGKMASTKAALLKRYIRRGQNEVEGWLTPGAIAIITKIDEAQKMLAVKGHLCEIGVHHGRLLILLYLLGRSDESVVALDIFGQQHLNPDKSGEGSLEIVIANLRTHAKDLSRLRIVSTDSQQITAQDIVRSAEGKIRLFSIDGGHRSEMAYHDLVTASKSLCEGGVIVLDDYFNEEWPGVSEGTNGFFALHKDSALIPFAIGGNKVFFTTSSYAAKYHQLLSSWVIGRYFVRRELFGHPVLCYGFRKAPPLVRLAKASLYPWYAFVKRMSKTNLWGRTRQTVIGRFVRKAIVPVPSFAVRAAARLARPKSLAWSLAALAVVASLIVVGRSGTPFRAPRVMDLGSGHRPTALAAGDFDRDGRLDFVVGSHDADDLIVFLGDGRGGFRRAGTLPAGPQPSEIAVADFDSDGRLDLAIANLGASRVTILWGDSQGGFRAARESPISVRRKPHPLTIAANDVDGLLHRVLDSKKDRRGETRGVSSKAKPERHGNLWPTNSGDADRYDLAAPDVAKRDVTIPSSDCRWNLHGAANRSVAARPSLFSVAVGDFNKDTKPDLIVANNSGHVRDLTGEVLSLLLNDGHGRFRPGPKIATGRASVDVAAADVDGDGHADGVAANFGSGDITVAFGGLGPDGLSSARSVTISAGGPACRILLADFDEDGRADAITANTASHSISILQTSSRLRDALRE